LTKASPVLVAADAAPSGAEEKTPLRHLLKRTRLCWITHN
jgi:hypothetical protein